jgi:Uma2 family endonuclease
MGLAQPQTYFYSFEEYLKLERRADERSEFIDGEIYAMAGESGRHGDISASIAGLLVANLRGSDCRARTKDTKVKSGALKERFGKGMISYPDLVVICGEPEYHDKHQDIVLNPAVIIEVLSETTEEFDRGIKFMRYRNFNDTLTDYILVSQIEPHVEHYIRQENGDWLLKEYYGLEAGFRINSINCSLNLAEIYDRIDFGE